jgi:hypothetical protein
MSQTRTMSLVESIANVLDGFGVATQSAIFPLFGLRTTLAENLAMGPGGQGNAISAPGSRRPACAQTAEILHSRGLQKHFDAVERRAVEFIERAGQHKQPVKCELPSRLRQGANLL